MNFSIDVVYSLILARQNTDIWLEVCEVAERNRQACPDYRRIQGERNFKK
jgi:hypothetical protein